MKWLLLLAFTNTATGELIEMDFYSNDHPDWWATERGCLIGGKQQVDALKTLFGDRLTIEMDCVPEAVT